MSDFVVASLSDAHLQRLSSRTVPDSDRESETSFETASESDGSTAGSVGKPCKQALWWLTRAPALPACKAPVAFEHNGEWVDATARLSATQFATVYRARYRDAAAADDEQPEAEAGPSCGRTDSCRPPRPRVVLKVFDTEEHGAAELCALGRLPAHRNVLHPVAWLRPATGELAMLMHDAGESLAQRIPAGGLAPHDLCRLIPQLLEAVAHLHANGVVHLDLKPENALVDGEGRLRLIDFGSAAVTVGCTFPRTRIFATPAYAPPELQGFQPHTGIPVYAHDAWMFGATCLHLLSGARPYSDLTAQLQRRFAGADLALQRANWIRREQLLPSLAAVPARSRAWLPLVQWCLSWSPADRPRLSDLRSLLPAATDEGANDADAAADGPTIDCDRGGAACDSQPELWNPAA